MAVAESGWMRDLLQGIMERKWRIYRKKAVTVDRVACGSSKPSKGMLLFVTNVNLFMALTSFQQKYSIMKIIN